MTFFSPWHRPGDHLFNSGGFNVATVVSQLDRKLSKEYYRKLDYCCYIYNYTENCQVRLLWKFIHSHKAIFETPQMVRFYCWHTIPTVCNRYIYTKKPSGRLIVVTSLTFFVSLLKNKHFKFISKLSRKL